MAEANFLESLASQSVVAWYNHLLQREDWARAALAAHAGKTARIDAGLAAVFLAVTPSGMLAAGTGEPSVTVALEPSAVAGALWDPAVALQKMRVQGDGGFAQALTDVLQKLRPDPAEDLSRWIGDAPAQRIVGALQAGMAQLREGAQRAARQGADYFVAENPMIIGRQEFAGFSQGIADVNRRLAALEAHLGDADAPARA